MISAGKDAVRSVVVHICGVFGLGRPVREQHGDFHDPMIRQLMRLASDAGLTMAVDPPSPWKTMATTLRSWLTNSNPIGDRGQAGLTVDVECATTARGDAASQYGRQARPDDQVGSGGGGVRVVEDRTKARLRLCPLPLHMMISYSSGPPGYPEVMRAEPST
jgi:hypothetical protein